MSWRQCRIGGWTRSAASASGRRISCEPATGRPSSGSIRTWRTLREQYENRPEWFRYARSSRSLNEKTRRRWAAVEARALGRGGIARVAEATGLSRATISAGLQELAAGPEGDDAAGRLRGPGAGRKALAEHDAGLVPALERLVDRATRGDPTGPLRWTCSSAARGCRGNSRRRAIASASVR